MTLILMFHKTLYANLYQQMRTEWKNQMPSNTESFTLFVHYYISRLILLAKFEVEIKYQKLLVVTFLMIQQAHIIHQTFHLLLYMGDEMYSLRDIYVCVAQTPHILV